MFDSFHYFNSRCSFHSFNSRCRCFSVYHMPLHSFISSLLYTTGHQNNLDTFLYAVFNGILYNYHCIYMIYACCHTAIFPLTTSCLIHIGLHIHHMEQSESSFTLWSELQVTCSPVAWQEASLISSAMMCVVVLNIVNNFIAKHF